MFLSLRFLFILKFYIFGSFFLYLLSLGVSSKGKNNIRVVFDYLKMQFLIL